MEKSVFVMETPKYCFDCPCEYYNGYYEEHQCRSDYGDWKSIEKEYKKSQKPDWCPLKPIKPNLVKALRCLASKDQYNYCYMNAYNRNRGDKPEMSCHGTIKSIPCPYHQDEYDTDFGSDGCQKLLNELADMLKEMEE